MSHVCTNQLYNTFHDVNMTFQLNPLYLSLSLLLIFYKGCSYSLLLLGFLRSLVLNCVCFSEVIKEYIQDAKAHISRMCQDMEAGLSMTSHYVDGQVSQRETLFQCGKNTNKFQDKELIILGDTDRKKSLLNPTQVQIFMR